MSIAAICSRPASCFYLVMLSLVLLAACGKKPLTPHNQDPGEQQVTTSAQISADGLPTARSDVISLPMGFTRDTGDLDAMVKRRRIRALIILNPVGFFYSQGKPQGAVYEALQEFQKFVNQKLKTGKLPVLVTFVPMRADQVERALIEGAGDLVANGVVVTPEREKKVLFSLPVATDVKQIIITGPTLSSVSSFEDLGGKEVFVNPISTYYQNLQTVNETLKRSGKPPIIIKPADKNLTDDDLIQMVNAGLVPATVSIQQRG